MTDPGLAFRTTGLAEAMALVAARVMAKGESPRALPDDETAAVEESALALGLRARRVLLDGRWWAHGGMTMLARLSERRRQPREGEPPGLRGWAMLVPGAGGYRLVALGGSGEGEHSWPVDELLASRLAPFAYVFHRRFAPRPLGTLDIAAFALRHARSDFAMLVACGLAAALVGLVTPVATGRLIDRAIPAASGSLVMALVAGFAAAGLAIVLLEAIRAIAAMRLEARTGLAVQAAVLDRVIGAPARFFRAFSSGDLAMRLGAVNTVQRSVTGAAIGALVTAAFLSANLALMLAYSPGLTSAALGVVGVAAACSIALGIGRVRIGRRIEAADGKLSSLAYETFAGIAKLRAAAAESRAFGQWHRRYREFRDLNLSSARLTNLETAMLALLQPAAVTLVLWLAWKLASAPDAKALSVGEFVAFQAAMFALLGGVHGLVSTALDLAGLAPLWERAKPLLETAPEDAATGKIRHVPQGAIELADVSFAYPGGPEVLSDIRLTIRPGEFVAIVGASGSGKSTLLRLLLGFEMPTRGTVRYDGLVLPAMDLRTLRSGIGTVLQGGRLWAGDLYANIAGAATLTVDDAWAAAREAGLEADIEAMPMGLYTMVGEGVSTLSGGQRQRVLIARALAGKPKILLLDEATSALDNLSQATVLSSLARREATRVVIAHRLATVKDADRIVVLEKGRIVQEGTFRELAAVPGPFGAMLARQVR